MFIEIFSIFIEDFYFDTKDIDDRVGVTGKDATVVTFWLLNLFFSSSKSGTTHHGVLVPELTQFTPKFGLLSLLKFSEVFTFLFSADLDLPAALLSKDDFGLGEGGHIGKTIINESTD